MTKVFITGATGYLGGEVLYQLCKLPGSFEITALVRSSSKANDVKKVCPKVRIVLGDLDDTAKIEEEAKAAGIVLHVAATGHLPSSEAIARGLSDSSRSEPGYWIQMSGASLYSITDINQNRYGETPERDYDDVKDIDAIKELIRNSPKRVVDQLVLAQDKVKTALLPGPLIFGTGRGPGNTKSIQTPAMVRYILQTGKGFRIGAGESMWSNVHVRDVASLFMKLVEAAVERKEGVWNEEGIYHTAAGGLTFVGLAQHMTSRAYAKGLIKSPNASNEIKPEDADVVMPHATVLLATNAVTKASRGKEALGWEPTMPALVECLDAIIEREVEDAKNKSG